MDINEVKKLILEQAKKYFPQLKRDYNIQVIEYTDDTYQLSLMHSNGGLMFRVITPFSEIFNERTINIIVTDLKNYEPKLTIRTGIKLGKEITLL